MGISIARRLIAAGYPLNVYNRTKSKADSLLQLGAEWADSPRRLAERSDVIVTMVSNDTAVAAIMEGNDGLLAGLAPSRTVLEMSTISPDTVEELNTSVRRKEAAMLHCPVLGGPLDVYNGRATIFVGGPKATFTSIASILEDISSPVHYIGEIAKASMTKFALNIMLTHYFMGLSSSLNFARQAKLPPYLVHDIITRIANPVVKNLGEKILNDDTGITFSMENFEKDQRYFLEAAEQLNISLPTIEAVQELAEKALDKGWGDKDFTALNKMLLPDEE
jgi:3-hydroxyisobutyrate dehydrogenase-like beta-hydroxyacid dehydrogenase